jgi:pentatricopeptide repeat protein
VSLQSLPFSSQVGAGDNLFAENERKARGLLDARILPLGSFTDLHAAEAKEVLKFFKRRKETDEVTVNLSISLIERIYEEMAISSNGLLRWKWICEPKFLNSILNMWKIAAKQGGKVISPMHVFNKLQVVSRKRPDYRYDSATIAIIMFVVIKQLHPRRAPFVVEDMLKFLKHEAIEKKRSELQPNAFIYNNVLQAWAVSGLPQVPGKMNSLIQSMRQERIALDTVTYNIVLRYWANQGAVDTIEFILEAMKKERLVPTKAHLAQAIYCYAKTGRTEKAEEMLEIMLGIQPENEQESCTVAECVQNIMLAYRMIVDGRNSNFIIRERAVERAEALFKKMSKNTQMTDDDHGE